MLTSDLPLAFPPSPPAPRIHGMPVTITIDPGDLQHDQLQVRLEARGLGARATVPVMSDLVKHGGTDAVLALAVPMLVAAIEDVQADAILAAGSAG